MTTQESPTYIALLGLAEHFRTSDPQNIRLCIHCLQSIFNINPPPHIEAKTHLQLGTILLSHAKNIDIAKTHIEKAWTISCSVPHCDDVRYESASLLAQVFSEKQSQPQNAKPILLQAIEMSQQSPYWHCRLVFQLAQIHTGEKDWMSAMNLMGMGADYASSVMSEYTRLLFMLSRGMIGLISKNIPVVNESMTQAGRLIEAFSGSPIHKEYLRVFFLVLQVCHYLMAGQVKSVKSVLKHLQQSIQTIAHNHTDDEPLVHNPAEMFQWLPKEHMCILVYLVTVMHSMQAGYMDKAQKYTDKALMQIEKLKYMDSNPLLSSFQLMLLEHIIMCRLIMGNKAQALHEISVACGAVSTAPRLLTAHGAQIHTLIGLYAMSMNCMEAAEAQFKSAVKMCEGSELVCLIRLNLAIVHLRTGRQAELAALEPHINPDTMRTASHTLKAAAFYVKGLQCFFQANFSDAKRCLRETLKMANAEDLNRLTSCSLVLLGHIFLSLGNTQEAFNLVQPAMQLASKIPDVHVQLWASSLLKDLYHQLGDAVNQAEGCRMHTSFSQQLLKDHFQSSQMPQHQIIQWTEGPCPIPLSGSTSGAGPML